MRPKGGGGGRPYSSSGQIGKGKHDGATARIRLTTFLANAFPFLCPPFSFLHETLAEMEERGEVIIITAVSGSEARERNGEEKNGRRGEERDV